MAETLQTPRSAKSEEERCSRCQSRDSPWAAGATAAHRGTEWSTDLPAAHGESQTRAGECALRIYIAGTACAGACSWQELRCLMSTHRIKFSCKNYSLQEIHPRAVLEELQPVERIHIVLWGDYNPYSMHPAPPKAGGGRKFISTIERGKNKGDEKGVFIFVLFLIILLCY